MPHPLWQSLATSAGSPLTEAQLEQLDRYLDALIEGNSKMNLTRIVDRPQAELKHIADALSLLKFLPPADGKKRTFADVGTGGGVPGVPIAIARPDLTVTLIDSTKKKLDAIDQMLAGTGIQNVATLHGRMEAVNRKFDIVVARAVSVMANLLEWCGPMMHPRSMLLAMKGPRAADEIEAIPMRVRKHFVLEVLDVDVAELPGHVVVRVFRA
jgi:16S rRNA (guanine527-N7)-methyltransferase